MADSSGRQTSIASELQLLYELALSTGASHDVEENCRRFVSVLLARKRLSFVSVWLRDVSDTSENARPFGYRLAFAKPRLRAATTWLPGDHASIRMLDAGSCVSVADTDPDYAGIVAETGAARGAYALFALGDFGLLKLYTQSERGFSDRELNQLRNVVEKFAVGLAGALVHERLREEMQRREVLENKLVHAQKFRATDNLSAGLAHDFNNILAVVLGFSSLGKKNVPDAIAKHEFYFEQIQQAGERGRDLVRQLLTFTQGSGNTPALVDLGQALGESVRLLEATIPAAVTISARQVGRLPKAYLEPGQVKQLIMNLCINASDAMQGEGRIDIVARVLSDTNGQCDSCGARLTGEYVELQLSDSGPGLARDIFPWIFDPLFASKALAKGTGLGLSVVHGILHAYGGHIQARNQPGGGAQFSLYLRPATDVPDLETAASRDLRDRSACGAGMRVMVVDDEPAVGVFFHELLTLEGFEVEVFTDSVAALRTLAAAPSYFDVLITDLMMPALSGVELILALREMRPSMPVVLCTGYTGTTLAHELAGLDKLVYLGKPIMPRRLLEALDELLPLEHPQAELANRVQQSGLTKQGSTNGR